MGAINYREIRKLLLDELVEYHGLTELEAEVFASNYQDKIIDEMWDAYGSGVRYHLGQEDYEKAI